MRRRWLVLLAAAGGIAAVGPRACGWAMLHAPGFLGRLRDPIGPPRPVVWETGPAPAALRGERPLPNIVVIVADDLGYNDLSFGGGGVAGGAVPTPRIDSIAKDGVEFTRGYAGNATCAPSRAAILTGRYPTRFGFEFTPAPKAFMRLIAHWGRNQEPAPLYFAEREADVPPMEKQGLPPEDLAFNAPHTPLQALRSDYDALPQISDHRLRVYGAMIRALDRGVGRVLETLRASGLEENTLVLFTSDNGGANYIGLPDINRPYRGWKMTFFEGGVHMPFFARWPAALPRGARFDAPVAHVDIFATAAAAAGAPLPADRKLDGVDLVKLARGEAQGRPHAALFWRSGHYRGLLADGFKLQVSERPPKTWLFDMNADPTERTNLAGARPDKVRELCELLARHEEEMVPPLWPALIEGPVRIDPPLGAPTGPDDEFVYWAN